MDNKIRIPWYRRNVRPNISEDEYASPESQTDMPIFPRVNRPRLRPQPEPVRQPVRQPSTVTNPAGEPSTVTNPSTQPNYGYDPAGEPAGNPAGNPTWSPNIPPMYPPIPIPGRTPGGGGVTYPGLPDIINNPNRGFGGQGSIQPNPQPVPPVYPGFPYPKDNVPVLPNPNLGGVIYSEEERIWTDNFVKQVAVVTVITGLTAREVYSFVSEYDYSQGMENFRAQATDQFGAVAATILTVAIVGKHLVTLWGRRAAAAFAPPIQLDDDFFENNFGSGKEI